MHVRKITSLTMLVSFLLLVLTSVVLYIVPHGRVAYWADWRLWGLSKTQWGDLHINLGFLFLLAGLLHLYYNWRPIVAYLRARRRSFGSGDAWAALLLCLAVGFGTYWRVPPLSSVLDLSERIKEAAAERYGEPPYGHAELSSIRVLSRQTGLDLERAMALLREGGVRVESEDQRLLDVARANGLSPKDVFAIMAPAKADQGAAGLPAAPPPGVGRKRLAEICDAYGLDLDSILAGLAAQGIRAEPDLSLKEIGAANDLDPHALYEILHALATDR